MLRKANVMPPFMFLLPQLAILAVAQEAGVFLAFSDVIMRASSRGHVPAMGPDPR